MIDYLFLFDAIIIGVRVRQQALLSVINNI